MTQTEATSLTTTDGSRCPFAFGVAPMAKDRTDGWAYFRAAGDVFRDDEGTWYVTSPEAYREVALNPEVFSSALAFDFQMADPKSIPIAVDPPDHADYRRVLNPMFGPRAVNAIEGELRRQAGELIDAFAPLGEVEVAAALCNPFPAAVFLYLFGLPLEDRDKLADWARTVLNEGDFAEVEQKTAAHATALESLIGYLRSHIEKKKQHPGGDGILSQIIAREGDDAWTDGELLGMAFMVTNAGLVTVRDTLTLAFYHLAKQPELRRQIAQDFSLIDPFIEEILRLEHAAPNIPRIARTDVTVQGHHIPAGSRVLMSNAAADRDPQKYATPDAIDLVQAGHGHLTFSVGIHRCLGSHLARRELRIVISEFLTRIPDFAIAPGVDPEVRWPSPVLGLETLPLVWTVGESA